MQITTNKLHAAIDDFFNEDLKSKDWKHKPTPDKWSKIEILGHLIDSAQINLQRLVRCTYEENFKLTYDQVECVTANRYQQASADDLIALWELLNVQIIRVLDSYPANRLNVQCDTGKANVSLHTVDWLATDYVVHLEHHLNQIIL
jgi:hypothetical protein